VFVTGLTDLLIIRVCHGGTSDRSIDIDIVESTELLVDGRDAYCWNRAQPTAAIELVRSRVTHSRSHLGAGVTAHVNAAESEDLDQVDLD
jgi:hypothetical protein